MGQVTIRAFDAVDLSQLRTADAAHVDLHQHMAYSKLSWQQDVVDH
jgi:hypothetical protein